MSVMLCTLNYCQRDSFGKKNCFKLSNNFSKCNEITLSIVDGHHFRTSFYVFRYINLESDIHFMFNILQLCQFNYYYRTKQCVGKFILLTAPQ